MALRVKLGADTFNVLECFQIVCILIFTMTEDNRNVLT